MNCSSYIFKMEFGEILYFAEPTLTIPHLHNYDKSLPNFEVYFKRLAYFLF